MRIAFVHDYLTQYGGAERVLDALYHLYPDSQRHVFTSLFAPQRLPPHMRAWPVTTSGLARLPLSRRTHRLWLPLYPRAFRRLGQRITDTDVVVADSSALSQHAAPANDAPMLVYCHAPAQLLYEGEHYLGASSAGALLDRLGAPLFQHLRELDHAAAQRPERLIANSEAVRERIRAVWDREARVVHPPVDTARFTPQGEPEPAPWFLIVSRLVPHKWIDRAIEASNRSGLPLRVIGTGRAEPSLRALPGPQVAFLGQQSDTEIVAAMQRCHDSILPGVEDFGMTAVEAQAGGRPVIAARGGGALKTVRDGTTNLQVPVGMSTRWRRQWRR